MKYKAERAKLSCFLKFVRELNNANDNKTSAKKSNILKARTGCVKSNVTTPNADIKLDEFTDHVSKKLPSTALDDPIKRERSTVNDEFVDEINAAIKKGTSRESGGKRPDHPRSFTNILGIHTNLFAALRSACGRAGATPEQRHEILLLPIHKDGSRNGARNFRPIALLST